MYCCFGLKLPLCTTSIGKPYMRNCSQLQNRFSAPAYLNHSFRRIKSRKNGYKTINGNRKLKTHQILYIVLPNFFKPLIPPKFTNKSVFVSDIPRSLIVFRMLKIDTLISTSLFKLETLLFFLYINILCLK